MQIWSYFYQFLQKIGNSEKTVDQEFETKREQWQKLVRLISAIDKELKKQGKLDGTFELKYINFST